MMRIVIMNEFIHSPIWIYDEDESITDEPPILQNDQILQNLAKQVMELYSSYYEFNSHNQACWFNEEQEKANKEKMLGLIRQLVARLNEINDGSFVIEDRETPYLKEL